MRFDQRSSQSTYGRRETKVCVTKIFIKKFVVCSMEIESGGGELAA
jgi:hypothetical protein